MHYDFIIVSKLDINPKHLDFKKFDEAEVFNNYIIVNNEKITYDYLIIDKLYPSLNLFTEDKHIITNQFLQTSNDYIYAIGSINNCNIDLEKQIDIIEEHIMNPF